MAKDSFYFPHDYNAHDDVKCLFLRQQLGMEGYGIFWFLIEKLANSGGKLPLKIIPVLAMQMQVPEVKVSAVIKQFELFQFIDNEFFSARLSDHLLIRKQLSESGKKGAKNRWGNRGANGVAIGEGNAKERKGKEIKEKEIIKESISSAPPTTTNISKDEILLRQKKFATQLAPFVETYGKEMIRAFYNHWIEPNKAKTKMRWELEKTWDLNLRLHKWQNNSYTYKPSNNGKQRNIDPSSPSTVKDWTV